MVINTLPPHILLHAAESTDSLEWDVSYLNCNVMTQMRNDTVYYHNTVETTYKRAGYNREPVIAGICHFSPSLSL